MGVVAILMSMLIYKSSLSPLFVWLLGARGVSHGMMVTINGVHLTVARWRMFGVSIMYMSIIMARGTPERTIRIAIIFSLI